MHHSLISTALLALQAEGSLNFRTKLKTIPTGFHKTVETDEYLHPIGKYRHTFYMDSKSPTGYSVLVEATHELPAIPLVDRHIESFEDFEEEYDKYYAVEATKATRRRQLGK